MKLTAKISVFVIAAVAALGFTTSAQANQGGIHNTLCNVAEYTCRQVSTAIVLRFEQNADYVKWDWMNRLSQLQAAGATPEEIEQAANSAKDRLEAVAYVACHRLEIETKICVLALAIGQCGRGRISNVLDTYWGNEARVKNSLERCCDEILATIE